MARTVHITYIVTSIADYSPTQVKIIFGVTEPDSALSETHQGVYDAQVINAGVNDTMDNAQKLAAMTPNFEALAMPIFLDFANRCRSAIAENEIQALLVSSTDVVTASSVHRTPQFQHTITL